MQMKVEGNVGSYKTLIKEVYAQAESVLKEDFSFASVSVNFVSDEEIQNLNKKFRNIDRATDVLSFPNLNKKANEKLKKYKNEADFDTKLVFLGDIVISKNVAKAQAKEYNFSLKQEVAFLALHGLLHLLGYDHIEEADERVMFKLQDEIMDRCGL